MKHHLYRLATAVQNAAAAHGITSARAAALLRKAQQDDGYSTEAVLIIAALVILAVTVVGVISAKVIGAAKGITF